MEYTEAHIRAAEFKRKLKSLLKEYDADISVNETLYCAFGEREQAISIYLSAKFDIHTDLVTAEGVEITLPASFNHSDL